MRVFILIGEKKIEDPYYTGWNRYNIGVYQTKQDATSEVSVSKALGRWEYDDYDIEEFDV